MRLPESAHTSKPWRIHELTRDFRLEDVWALPRPAAPTTSRGWSGGRSLDPAESFSRVARALWAIRWKVGALLGWDSPDRGVGARVPTLGDRLPEDLRGTDLPAFTEAPFSPLYVLEDEFAAEIANRTVHGVLHLGWVPDGAGRYHGQMAVLVKPDGVLGEAYMAAINPFRHLIVYRALPRRIERDWRTPSAPAAAAERR